MERNDIIKALECCSHPNGCRECPVHNTGRCWDFKQDAISLIKELTEELEVTLKQYTAYQEAATQRMRELTEENENLHASCTELTRKLECANLEIECKERILESYMLQYGTVADKEVWLKKERADTVRKMQSEIEARCIKGGIYPAFVKRTIDQIAKEMMEEEK